MARPLTGAVVEREGKRGTTYALRFRALGRRWYITTAARTRAEAEQELANELADVRRGIWQPPASTDPVVEEPQAEPTFHQFSSEWVAAREHGVDARTSEHWKWALSSHLLPFLGPELLVSQITPALVDRYRASKLAERERHEQERARAKKPGPRRGLNNGSINKTLKVLAQILDDAVEYGYLDANPARGKKRRLKQAKPKRTWLELDEVRDLLEAAGDDRPLLATMILAGLRVGELTSLRWRALNLANGTLVVEESKTDAGEGRVVDLSPMLLEELKVHRAGAVSADPDGLVFPSSRGTPLHRANVSNRILAGAITAANETRAKAGRPPIQAGVTNHSLRRTFCALLYEAGASPAYVMAQMGHTSSGLALEVYAKKMERQRDTGARMDALIRGAEWTTAEASAPSHAAVS